VAFFSALPGTGGSKGEPAAEAVQQLVEASVLSAQGLSSPDELSLLAVLRERPVAAGVCSPAVVATEA
jgi:hypothetical protein